MVAALSGDRRTCLAALRDVLAGAIQDAAPRDLSPLAGKLMAVLADLDGLPPAGELNPAAQLEARMRQRLAAARNRV